MKKGSRGRYKAWPATNNKIHLPGLLEVTNKHLMFVIFVNHTKNKTHRLSTDYQAQEVRLFLLGWQRHHPFFAIFEKQIYNRK